MKIGIIALSLNQNAKPGFYHSQELGLGKALAKQGHQVLVYKLIAKKKSPKPVFSDTLSEGNLQYIYLPASGLGINGFFSLKHLDRTMDLLICFCDTQLYTPCVEKWCFKHHIRFIPYIGIITSTSTSPLFKRIMNIASKRLIRLYQKQSSVWCKTPTVCETLKSMGIVNPSLFPIGLDEELMHKEYATADICKLKKNWNYDIDEQIILFIGRLTAEKEPVEMIELFAKAYMKNSALRLCMIGKGELQGKIEQTILAHGLSHAIRLIPSVPYDRMWELYRISNCFVNLNHHEIYGMSILEALYYECPVIAYHAPGPDFILSTVPNYLATTKEEIIHAMLSSQYMENNICSHFTWNYIVQNNSSFQLEDESHQPPDSTQQMN